jgi:hypothetical protein
MKLAGALVPVVATVAAAAPAAAQSGALVVFVQGGPHKPLTNLAVDASDQLASGLSVGGGVSLLLGPGFALRGYAMRVRSEYRGDALQAMDSTMTRVFVGGDLLLGRALEIGLAPYLFGGLGAVRVDPSDRSLASFTRLASRAGAGINYVIENSRLTPYVESGFWFYRFNRFGFDRIQTDITVALGLALTLPY